MPVGTELVSEMVGERVADQGGGEASVGERLVETEMEVTLGVI